MKLLLRLPFATAWVLAAFAFYRLLEWQAYMSGGRAFVGHVGQGPSYAFGMAMEFACALAALASLFGLKVRVKLLLILKGASIAQLLSLLAAFGYTISPAFLLVSMVPFADALAPFRLPGNHLFALPICIFFVALLESSLLKAAGPSPIASLAPLDAEAP